MLKNLVNTISIIFVYCICCIFIYGSSINNPNTSTEIKSIYQKDGVLGMLKIEKIGINNPIYKISSSENNVDKNITILEGSILPDQENSIMFIAAHSGTGNIAYFNNLDKLEIDDEISFFYKNKEYKYFVLSIYEENKNGYIHVNKMNKNQLILTTCSKNKGKQLVLNCIAK